ncbi:MAG: NTP transferase domain-containing protein [Flavobacteriales bacterium]|nr:NTP transferase domain-containing protein [Flavobacteriales bacterium]NCG30249.1 NTP transferase domain-containing protein [Bacteroidota bacterium]MBT3964583.1 NTP transferase domain-containing protein [Flavobacteriales bacterium]MBT4704603.1 NTP transferase domain-containing protein [Flavobacteriales bacterium]MBT4930776.1 NTP transferase domain-containing protein [Flavobacteriales bacterium]
MEEPFDFLNPFLSNTPIYRIAEVNLISQEIQKKFGQNSTELKGLVLTGGKSSRMGKDKGSIDYHGKAQREHAADILQAIVGNSYLSVRDESTTFESQYELIADSFLDLGPFGGILSAFRRFPDCAWLVVATDIPGLSSELVTELVKRRNPSKVATCFYNPETKFPEPLITIWEPRAYHVMLEFLANGMSCPRKVLINSNVEMIDEPRYYEDLINVNTPEELKAFTIK